MTAESKVNEKSCGHTNGVSFLRRSGPRSERPGQAGQTQAHETWRLTHDPRDESEVATELVRRVAAGDVAAEAALVRRYSPRVFRVLLRRSGDRALADDLHQETFGVALVRLRARGIDRPECVGAFLLQTARNLLIAEYRKASRRGDRHDTHALRAAIDPRTGQLRRTLRREEAELVWSLIRDLRHDRDREILYRAYIIEDEPEQICLEMGLRRGHFRRLLYRARRRLGSLLEGHEKRRRLQDRVAAGL